MFELLGFFPHTNAALNALSGILLICGLVCIRRRKIRAHRLFMLSACVVSTAFIISYLTYHSLRTYYFGLGPTRFTGEGFIRPVYFSILTSHTILAGLVAPFVIWTLFRALKKHFDAHRKIARLVLPVWLYVSLSGVAVYLLLYQFYPAR